MKRRVEKKQWARRTRNLRIRFKRLRGAHKRAWLEASWQGLDSFRDPELLGQYMLGGRDGRTPVLCRSGLDWAQWYELSSRLRARHVRWTRVGRASVSTVFLGLDHNFAAMIRGHKDLPLIFETMIFGGEHDGEQWRYATWREAEEGHAFALALARSSRLEKVLS